MGSITWSSAGTAQVTGSFGLEPGISASPARGQLHTPTAPRRTSCFQTWATVDWFCCLHKASCNGIISVYSSQGRILLVVVERVLGTGRCASVFGFILSIRWTNHSYLVGCHYSTFPSSQHCVCHLPWGICCTLVEHFELCLFQSVAVSCTLSRSYFECVCVCTHAFCLVSL